MAPLNYGPTAGTSGTAGATGNTTSVTTGIVGAGAGSTGAAGATAIENDATDDGAALPAYTTGTSGTGTAIFVASTGAGSAGAPGSTGTSTATAVMVGTTKAGTARTTGIAIQEDIDKTQVRISLPAPKANLAKELYNTPTHKQRCLPAQIHAFLLQESPNLTQLNDDEKQPVMGIINIPKSSTIRVLHSFGVRTNPIVGSPPIAGKILSLVGDVSSSNPPQSMLLPREVFHKTSIRVTNQDSFEQNFNNTQSFPL